MEADQKEEGKRGTKQIVEPDPAFWLFGPNTATTHPGVGDRKLRIAQMASSSLSVEQSMQKSSSQQQTNIYCLLVCKMNDDTLSRIWGLLQREQRWEGVRHDINSLAEQGVTSRAISYCFRRAFIPHTTIQTPCARRAAAKGLHSYSSEACSHYVSFSSKPEKKKKHQ